MYQCRFAGAIGTDDVQRRAWDKGDFQIIARSQGNIQDVRIQGGAGHRLFLHVCMASSADGVKPSEYLRHVAVAGGCLGADTMDGHRGGRRIVQLAIASITVLPLRLRLSFAQACAMGLSWCGRFRHLLSLLRHDGNFILRQPIQLINRLIHLYQLLFNKVFVIGAISQIIDYKM